MPMHPCHGHFNGYSSHKQYLHVFRGVPLPEKLIDGGTCMLGQLGCHIGQFQSRKGVFIIYVRGGGGKT